MFIILIYVLYGQTYLTNDFLMPALEQISKRWKLSETGTGILMALGISVPELTTNILSCYKPQMIGYGFGAIVGSGCFDFTVCFGIMSIFSAYYHEKPLKMKMKALIRDIYVYLCTLLFLTFVFWDYQISLIEAIVLTSFYPTYLTYSIMELKDKDNFEFSIGHQDGQVPTILPHTSQHQIKEEDLEGEIIGEQEKQTTDEEQLEEPHWTLTPFKYIFKYLIPKNPELAFIVISGYCFLSANLTMSVVDDFVDQYQVSAAFVGLTIASWGGNISDVLNASIAAKNKKTELATSSIIGSQILNLQICLGLPWLLTIIVHNQNITFYDEHIFGSMIAIVVVVILSFTLMMLNQLRLTYSLGVMLLTIYVIYFIFEFYQQ